MLETKFKAAFYAALFNGKLQVYDQERSWLLKGFMWLHRTLEFVKLAFKLKLYLDKE